MKRYILLIVAVFGLISANAQKKAWGETPADSVKCWEQYNIFGSLYQSKSYADAYEGWYEVYTNCPGAHKNIYVMAPKILDAKIKKTEDPAEKAALQKLFIEQYDNRLIYFPGKEGYVKGQKALKYAKFNKDSTAQAYAMFKEAYDIDGYKISPSVMNGYFLASVRMFNAKEIELAELVDAYDKISEAIEKNNNELNLQIKDFNAKKEAGELDAKGEKKLARTEKILSGYDKVGGNIEKMISPVLTCSRLPLLYNDETFEKNKDNTTWLRRGIKAYQKERKDEEGNDVDCTSEPIFFRMAEALFALEPSATAARGMSSIALKNKDYAKAVEYSKQAAEEEIDPKKQANDYYKIAIGYQKLGNLSSAKTYALKAAANKKDWGAPHILLATIYADAAGKCGADAVQKNAVYWAAINKASYAKSIDSSVANIANKLIAAYKKSVPDKSVAFQLGYKAGDTYTIGCWINETVTIKFY
ncbi:MAG: hypothetical protein SchgKO_09200 [Schleiferiaceae bacterium]